MSPAHKAESGADSRHPAGRCQHHGGPRGHTRRTCSGITQTQEDVKGRSKARLTGKTWQLGVLAAEQEDVPAGGRRLRSSKVTSDSASSTFPQYQILTSGIFHQEKNISDLLVAGSAMQKVDALK